MAMLTVRHLDDDLKRRLRIRAAHHGRSMEEEVRRILRDALDAEEEPSGLGSRVHARVLEATGGVELELPPRSAPRPPPGLAEGEQ
jgi:plasmid stability protein